MTVRHLICGLGGSLHQTVMELFGHSGSRLIEQPSEDKQQMVFAFIDTLVVNQKLNATLSAVSDEVA